jgi:hypothetical protein
MSITNIDAAVAKMTAGPYVPSDRYGGNGVFTFDGQLIANTHGAQGPDMEKLRAQQDANAAGIVALKNGWPAVMAELAAKDAEIARLREALQTIFDWQFPRVPDAMNPGETVSYGYAFGSNGERDYMRSIARTALKGTGHER